MTTGYPYYVTYDYVADVGGREVGGYGSVLLTADKAWFPIGLAQLKIIEDIRRQHGDGKVSLVITNWKLISHAQAQEYRACQDTIKAAAQEQPEVLDEDLR